MAQPVAIVLQTRVSKKDHTALKKAAKEADITLSAYIRAILKAHLKKG